MTGHDLDLAAQVAFLRSELAEARADLDLARRRIGELEAERDGLLASNSELAQLLAPAAKFAAVNRDLIHGVAELEAERDQARARADELAVDEANTQLLALRFVKERDEALARCALLERMVADLSLKCAEAMLR